MQRRSREATRAYLQVVNWCKDALASRYRRVALPPRAITDLQRKLKGRIVLPSDPTYDSARKLKNPRFDPHPSAIILCACENDVCYSLDAVRRFCVRFTVRSGGHSTAGFSANNSVLIDVRGLNNIEIDSHERTVTVGAGCTAGEVQKALATTDLHVPFGNDDVAVGGFVQGGGYGITSRIFGMNSDNVLEMRIVLADGRIVLASEDTNYDLWWAMRGGTGGNFGILLGIKYRLHDMKHETVRTFAWPLAKETGATRWQNPVAALSVLQGHYCANGPTQVGAGAGVKWLRPHDPPVLWIEAAFTGPPNEADEAFRPLSEIPGSVVSNLGEKALRTSRLLADVVPQTIEMKSASVNPPSDRRSVFISGVLTPDDWRSIIDMVLRSPTRYPEFEVHCYGGAINAYPGDKSVFIHRDASLCSFLLARWFNEQQRQPAEAYLREWQKMMEKLWNGHIYQNFPSADYKNYRWNYWGHAFPTLLKIKQKYDPTALFAFPQMVRPGSAAAKAPWLVARSLDSPIKSD